MAGVEGNVSNNAVKLLFAEDLVNYVMLSYDTSFDFAKKAERFRNYVHNAFNENVRDAVDFLTCQFHMGNSLKFEILEAAHMNNESSFLKIADCLREKFFSKGFEARKFLYYCAHLSSMAGIFYTSGIKEAPHIAADAISKSLSGYPIQSGAWHTVDTIAAELSNMALNSNYNKCPVDSLVEDHYKNQSPRGNSPKSNDETSEDDSSHDSSPDFERGVLKYISLEEFLGIDAEWKNTLLPLLSEREDSSSYESSEDNISD